MLSQLSYDPIFNFYVVFATQTTRMGLEPTTSAVTGRRSNQLSHRAILFTFIKVDLQGLEPGTDRL